MNVSVFPSVDEMNVACIIIYCLVGGGREGWREGGGGGGLHGPIKGDCHSHHVTSPSKSPVHPTKNAPPRRLAERIKPHRTVGSADGNITSNQAC